MAGPTSSSDGERAPSQGGSTEATTPAPGGDVREERRPPVDHATEMAPGILRIQLPISMPGLGHVNCYALEDDRGWALVDPGLPGRGPWRELTRRLDAAGIPLRRVHTVVVTHSHPDHFGAAEAIRRETGAELVTEHHFKTFWDPDEEDDEEKDLAATAAHRDEQRGALDRIRRAARDLGASHPRWDRPTPWGGRSPRPGWRMRMQWRLSQTIGSRYLHPPTPTSRVIDGEVVKLGGREWTALHTPGHTTDHLCLFDADGGIVISGDHVLPTITPHISGLTRTADPLRQFFDSLERMHTLDDVSLVLPAHGLHFDDLSGRVGAIERHHAERLTILVDAGDELGEANVGAYSQRLFRPRSWGPMADSETYAHLEHLRHEGRAERRRVEGELRYRITA
ncbi:MAG: MBL fold metallo-hydrolase [Actinomycetota bacterium]|nr:MBL fold metallo-hydrolase [Actinomycetota bacterium]